MPFSDKGAAKVLLAVIGLLASSSILKAEATAPLPTHVATHAQVEEELLTFETRLHAATMRRDLDFLRIRLAADLSLAEADGYITNGAAAYLDHLAKVPPDTRSVQLQRAFVRIEGDVAVTHGILTYAASADGSIPEQKRIYSGVYIRGNPYWKLVAWHTTTKKPQ